MSVAVDTPPLEITERDGQKRKLVLAGRALPFKQSGISFGIKQRSTTTFYAGNPIGSRQVFGPTLNGMELSGSWSDRWLGQVTDDGINVTAQAVAEIDGFQVASLADLDAYLESLCGSGIELELKWAHKVRVGTLEEYEGTFRTIHELEWKMSFQWLSRGETAPPATLVTSNPGDQLAKWADQADELEAAVAPTTLQAFSDAVLGIVADVNGAVAAINDYVDQVTQFTAQVLSPAEVVLALAAALEGVKTAAKRLLNTVTIQIDRALVQAPASIVAVGQGLNPDTIGDGLAAAAWLRGLKDAARATRDAAAQEQQERLAQADQRLLDIYVAKDGDDLRAVSVFEYGTPEEWRRLMTFNGLSSSRLEMGQVVMVPQLSGQAA